MKIVSKWSMLLAFAMVLAGVQLITTTTAHAQSSYFTSRGCVNCHSAPAVATCAGCHQHSGTLTATKNKTTSYAPGETVSITLSSSGARSGWVGVRLYNQTGAEIARSTGSQSGMGGSAVFPAVLSAPAPATAGTYTWRIAYLGNNNGTGSGDVHSEKSVNVSVTVASAADTTAPTVGAFTLPATSTSLTVPVSSLTASDNTAVTGYLVTTSATAPAASAAGWSASAPASVTAPAAGTVTFYAWAKDAAGNVSASRSASVTITLPDTAAPTVGAFTLPATSTSLTVPVSSLTASDNVAVTGYLVNTSATKPLASAAGWSASAPTSVTAPAAGTVTFYAWAKDAAGNVSASRSASVTITITVADTAAPTVSAFTLPATSTSLTVPVSSLTASDNVAVTGYLVNTSATAPAASAAGWSASAPTSVTAPAAGTVTFYAWAKDAAGNVSAARSASVVITIDAPAVDITKPVLTISTLANGAITNNQVLNVSGRATDDVALDNVTVNGSIVPLNADGSFSTALTLLEGANTITVVAADKAGNRTTITRTITYQALLDSTLSITAPVDNLITSRSILAVKGTTTEHSTVTVSVNGREPQVASMSGNVFTASVYLARGINTIAIKAVDPAGNISNAKRTVTYDGTRPTLAVTEPNQDLIVSNPTLVLKGTVADNLSAVTVRITMDGKTYRPVVTDGAFTQQLTFTTEKQYSIVVTATDAAGNRASVRRNVIFQTASSDDDEHDDDEYDD